MKRKYHNKETLTHKQCDTTVISGLACLLPIFSEAGLLI